MELSRENRYRKGVLDRQLQRRKVYRQLTAKKNNYDKNYCSSMVKRYTAAEIAEYEKSLKNRD